MKKVLFHIDEGKKWEMVLKNAGNMMDHYRKNAISSQIEIVANGEAVKEYSPANSELQEVMQKLAQQTVMFVACSNALKASGLAADDIFPFVVIVPVGVVELADRQLEGYAYIMP